MKRLKDFTFYNEKLADIVISDIQLDSRLIKQGDLFIALKGHQNDGRNFIANAVEKGAKVVLCELVKGEQADHILEQFAKNIDTHYKIILVENLSQKVSKIAHCFYENPADKLSLVAVTGTNGKTTISNLLAQWQQLLGKKSAVMGTMGNGLYGNLQESNNTTPSAVEIAQYFTNFVKQDVDFCAMEVSSHSLVQHRVKDLYFNAVIFTNLTRDHLDYHKTMDEYEKAKSQLFFDYQSDIKIINYDDEVGRKWLEKLPDAVAYSCDPSIRVDREKFVRAKAVDVKDGKAFINVHSSWGNAILESGLVGSFNVSNLMAAFATLLSLGEDFNKLVETAPQLANVCGRMQSFSAKGKPTAIIDYAHTPDALEKALIAAKEHCKGKLWCIFGCGGDRDSGKRPQMAQIAERYADKVIVTDDNPRSEDSDKIADDILKGFSSRDNVEVIYIRQYAIEKAMKKAKERDVILIAGKGHENYQIIGTKKFHFSDQEEVQKYL